MKVNIELENHYSLFANKQGSGYIFDNETDILNFIHPCTVTLGTEMINPGDLTSLDNYLLKKVKYLGMVNGNGMILYYGADKNLFPKHYYGLIWIISKTRIFEMYSAQAGTDHIFVNGKWKRTTLQPSKNLSSAIYHLCKKKALQPTAVRLTI